MQKNKQLKKFLSALILLVAIAPLSIAQAEVVDIQASPGITPEDGSLLYGLDTALENIRLQLSNNPNAGLEIAEEKLAEIAAINQSEGIEKANERRQIAIQRASDKVKTEEQAQSNEGALNKHTRVLKQLKGRLPEQAQQGINTAIENSENQLEEIPLPEERNLPDQAGQGNPGMK